MGKLKLGKQPKRLGGPSAQFLARKAAAQDASDQKAPSAGLVPVYLDDERPCPKGWTLARTPKALFDLIEDRVISDRITHLSLDWHLGAGISNGEAVADRLAERFRAEPDFLPSLKAIGLHSSDREKAISMFHTLMAAIPEERQDEIWVDTGTPSL